MSNTPEDSLLGQSLKDFHIQERIGRGGMATVYRAHQASVNRDVALKVINLQEEDHESDFRQRFAQEAQLVAGLEHIHILPVYDYGIVGERAFLAMRLLRGGTLQDLIGRPPLTLDRSADLFKEFAAGLTYAHQRGIIHRDLKPNNIMLDDAGHAYVTDFGLAKMIDQSLNLTRNDRIVGTPNYMAPEQLRGEVLTPRADIYSLGVVLYTMLSGKSPYGDKQTSDLISRIYHILEHPAQPLRQIAPNVPENVERVVMKALSKDPAQRFSSPDEMARSLNEALGRSSSSSYPAFDSTQMDNLATARPSRPKPAPLALGLALLTLVIFAGLGFLWLAGGEDSDPETDLTTPRPVQVLTGETAQAKDIIPDPAAIARAQAFLGEEGVIGLLACNLSSEYHATHTREMSDFARAYGLRTKTFDADSDAYKQLTLLEQARNEGIQAMIVCALDNELMGPALESAQAGGIRMVFIHNDSASYGGVRLGGDDYMLGYVPGQYAGEVLQDRLGGRGGVIILDYPDLEAVVIRANGMEDGLLSRSPEAEILGRYLGGTQEFAYESVKGLLEEGIKFEVVLSINDAGAYGAIQALEEFDYQGDEVIIVSVDAEVQARQYMREGRFIWGSVAAGRTESAKAAIDAMVDLLAGEPIAENILTEPGELITRQTLAEQEN